LDRFPSLELEAATETLKWGSDIIFRDLKALPLRYR
jgi:hypothetical protein